jgi:hypothetical protein
MKITVKPALPVADPWQAGGCISATFALTLRRVDANMGEA